MFFFKLGSPNRTTKMHYSALEISISKSRCEFVHVTTAIWPWYVRNLIVILSSTNAYCGNQSALIELHQSGVIAWRPRQHRRSCGVFKSWISVTHCPFERKWRVLHIWYISVLEQVGMSFNGIAHLMKGLAFVQAGVPSCAPWWRGAPLVREFQIWYRRCKQWDSHWFWGRKMRFCGIRSTMLR